MRKRAVDLSLEELAAMGANAALVAAQRAGEAGLVVAGTADVVQDGRVVSSLVQRRPSGEVTDLAASSEPKTGGGGSRANAPRTGKSAD